MSQEQRRKAESLLRKELIELARYCGIKDAENNFKNPYRNKGWICANLPAFVFEPINAPTQSSIRKKKRSAAMRKKSGGQHGGTNLEKALTFEALLGGFHNYIEMSTLNGEPVVMTTKSGRELVGTKEASNVTNDNNYLNVYLDFPDPTKMEDFINTCFEPSFSHMVYQTWSVKDGYLYLDDQKNHSSSPLCDGTEMARKTFRKGALKLWCMFLSHGLKEGIFNDGTGIKLYVSGSYGNISESRDERQKALLDYYTKLGFTPTGEYPQGFIDHPIMISTVGRTLKSVC